MGGRRRGMVDGDERRKHAQAPTVREEPTLSVVKPSLFGSVVAVAVRVVLVEDDDAIAQPLQRVLEREGYDVLRVADGTGALDLGTGGDIDLMLLDLNLPDMDGLEVCSRLREAGSSVPIVMLTARADELDRVVGLDSGADDYLAKPFGLAELHARMRAVLRRRGAPADPAAAASEGQLRVDRVSRRVLVGETEVHLTPKEFAVLALLFGRSGSVVTRETLMNRVWDKSWYGSTKTLDVTVARLRQKLDDAGASAQIVTLRSVGFRLEL